MARVLCGAIVVFAIFASLTVKAEEQIPLAVQDRNEEGDMIKNDEPLQEENAPSQDGSTYNKKGQYPACDLGSFLFQNKIHDLIDLEHKLRVLTKIK